MCAQCPSFEQPKYNALTPRDEVRQIQSVIYDDGCSTKRFKCEKGVPRITLEHKHTDGTKITRR